jgi:hypothetical protein
MKSLYVGGFGGGGMLKTPYAMTSDGNIAGTYCEIPFPPVNSTVGVESRLPAMAPNSQPPGPTCGYR